MSPALHFTRINPEANMRRFYRISVQPGLFGGVALVREWGRIGTRGQSMEQWFKDEDAAQAASDTLAAQKQRRGYVSLPDERSGLPMDANN